MANPQTPEVESQKAETSRTKHHDPVKELTAKPEKLQSDESNAIKKESKEQKPFRLLDLPPELWTEICKHEVESVHPVLLKPGKEGVAVRQPAILKVCHQIRNQCLPYFYRANQFEYIPEVHSWHIGFRVDSECLRDFNRLVCVPPWDFHFWFLERVMTAASGMWCEDVLSALQRELETGKEEQTLSPRTKTLLETGIKGLQAGIREREDHR